MITISNLHLGHVGFNCDFESQNLRDRQREREVLCLCILSVELVADQWNRSVDFWTKTQVFGDGGPIPVSLWPPQIPHGLVEDFKCYHEGQMSFHAVPVVYTNLRSKIYSMCELQARRQTCEKLRHVCPSIRSSTWSNSAPAGQIFVKFGVWVLFGDRENSSFFKIWQE